MTLYDYNYDTEYNYDYNYHHYHHYILYVCLYDTDKAYNGDTINNNDD